MKPKNEPNRMRFYLRHCAFGFMLSALFGVLLLWRDVAGLGSLVAGSDIGILAVFLLWFFNGTVFCSVQFALATMCQAGDKNNDDDYRGTLIPVRVATTTRSARL